ncbi:MAG: hypothetical protein CUN56_09480 [Phototrophicales bacterium]|nr:MAG: hypothetical protein CUN56_09480 [Phototrophicales bacterium]RMG70733.1 MAG: hypothetical protein D6711_16690 [Chloroflexota bacterium]
MTQRTRKQPPDFRKEEVSYVMQRWRAGDSCSLVGVGSVGKSNLLQHLADPQTQQAYMNITKEDDFKAIIIDPAMLGPLPNSGSDVEQIRCWAGYELMMHRLFMAFYPFDILGRDEAQRFYDTYQALQDGTNPLYAYMGLRYFELGLDFFMRRGVRIVFMFDEFEDMLKNLPVKFFQTLRGLRDANKRQLSYLTFTRAPLPLLINHYGINPLEIEPFSELFNDNVLYVGPYNETDAYRMVQNLMERNQKQYSDEVIRFLMWATGRYAGLLRSGFRQLDAIGTLDAINMMNDEALRRLALRRPIRDECKTLWSSLTDVERYVLKAVARLTEYSSNTETENAVAILVQKRLLRVDKDSNSLSIEPPVFRMYVLTNPDES